MDIWPKLNVSKTFMRHGRRLRLTENNSQERDKATNKNRHERNLFKDALIKTR